MRAHRALTAAAVAVAVAIRRAFSKVDALGMICGDDVGRIHFWFPSVQRGRQQHQPSDHHRSLAETSQSMRASLLLLFAQANDPSHPSPKSVKSPTPARVHAHEVPNLRLTSISSAMKSSARSSNVPIDRGFHRSSNDYLDVWSKTVARVRKYNGLATMVARKRKSTQAQASTTRKSRRRDRAVAAVAKFASLCNRSNPSSTCLDRVGRADNRFSHSPLALPF